MILEQVGDMITVYLGKLIFQLYVEFISEKNTKGECYYNCAQKNNGTETNERIPDILWVNENRVTAKIIVFVFKKDRNDHIHKNEEITCMKLSKNQFNSYNVN